MTASKETDRNKKRAHYMEGGREGANAFLSMVEVNLMKIPEVEVRQAGAYR
jgi:hypothetical protein